MYICSRRRKSEDCTNKYVSDVSLGPFVLNFFANLIKASNSFGRTTSIETLEKKLLRGEALSRVDHIERERITKALSEVDSRINELDIANAFDLSLSDEAFMQKASQFILTQQLLDKRYVNYERFIRKIDPKIVKDFLNETVSNFCIKDGLTTSILLKNGIELRFSYKTAE